MRKMKRHGNTFFVIKNNPYVENALAWVGNIYIDESFYNKLTSDALKHVLLHELGHLQLGHIGEGGLSEEIAADAFAFRNGSTPGGALEAFKAAGNEYAEAALQRAARWPARRIINIYKNAESLPKSQRTA